MADGYIERKSPQFQVQIDGPAGGQGVQMFAGEFLQMLVITYAPLQTDEVKVPKQSMLI